MSGFSALGSNYRLPVLHANPDDVPGEPIFVVVPPSGGVRLVTQDLICEEMEEVYHGRVELDELIYEMYLQAPGARSLAKVAVGFAGKTGNVKLTFSSELGVMWSCDL